MNNKIIQSYVYHNNKRYFISTIERSCSATDYQERYNETMVWEWPEGDKERGVFLLQDEDRTGSITAHLMLCDRIYQNGITEEN